MTADSGLGQCLSCSRTGVRARLPTGPIEWSLRGTAGGTGCIIGEGIPVWLLHAILLPIKGWRFGKPRRTGKA